MRGNHRKVWVGTFQAAGTARVRGPRTMNVRNREASMSRRERTRARATGNETAEYKDARHSGPWKAQERVWILSQVGS